MTYSWSPFDIESALNGTLVGVGGSTTPDDISKVAGKLSVTTTSNKYKVVINGKTAVIDKEGRLLSCVPEGSFESNQKFYLATTVLEETVGNSIDRTRSQVPGHTNTAVISQMEPRDHFAVQILNAMLAHVENPVEFDDANIALYTRSAYRWAQGMMNAAADAREGQADSSQSQTTVEVNPGDLENNTEKLLYNMSRYMKKGVAIVGAGSTEEEPMPVIVGGSDDEETPSIGVVVTEPVPVVGADGESPISTTIDGEVDVNVTNMPSDYVKTSEMDDAAQAIIMSMPRNYATSSDIISQTEVIVSHMPDSGDGSE